MGFYSCITTITIILQQNQTYNSMFLIFSTSPSRLIFLKKQKGGNCVINPKYLPCKSVNPPFFLRTKVGAKSVRERRIIEFGTEEERRMSELSRALLYFQLEWTCWKSVLALHIMLFGIILPSKADDWLRTDRSCGCYDNGLAVG